MVSALFAMGRSYDKRWREPVLEMLDHDSPDIRLEAARAAGEIELSEAREALIEMLEDDDINVRMAASWSLSQIGGSGVQQALTRQMEESDDPEEIDHLENAIDNLLFTEELSFFDIMDIPEDGLELDFDESEDLFD
jgi:HEAT repeat protein